MTPYRCGASRRSRSWPTSPLVRHTDVAAAQNHCPKVALPSRSASPDVTPPADASPSTSLAEFAHLVRLEAHLAEKRRRLHVRLCRGLKSGALTSRFVRSGKLAHRALVDHYKLDDTTGFATLYNALHDVRNSCEATRRYAFVEPDLDVRTAGLARAEASAPPASGFLDQLPPRIKDELLQFLSDLRTDPDFLAGRLTSLSPSELSALAPSYPPYDPAESVLASPFRARPQGSPFSRVPVAGGRSSSSASPVDRLLSFQRRDPLSALLHTLFAESSGPHAAEDLRRTEIWSTACARLITDGTAGGEQFMRAVLNSWAAMRDWPVKRNLELFLMSALQDGAHLLDSSAGKRTYEQGPAARPEMAAPKPTVTADDFYSTAINDLFALIANQPNHGGLPLGVYAICNAIMSKLMTVKKQRAARTFMVCKWFFSSFLLDAIIYPESHGMMAGYHISPLARQKILKEIAVRAQRHVWDVCYDWTPLHPIRSEVRQNIEVILSKFSPEASKPMLPPSRRSNSLQVAPETSEVQPYLMLCASDISMLVDALFPERRPTSSLAGDGNNLREGFIPSPFVMSEASLSSQPQWHIHRSADLGSLPSNSGSSVLSDSVSQDRSDDAFGHQPDGMSSYTSVGSRETLLDMPPPTTVEMRGQRLRSLISHLPSYLGHDALTASSHPCAEQWTILYISRDGKSLATTTSDISGPGQAFSMDALSDTGGTRSLLGYSEGNTEHEHDWIKDALVRLVSDYEVPVDAFAEAEDGVLSDRFSTFHVAPGGASQAPSYGGLNLHAAVMSSVRRKGERHVHGCQHVPGKMAGARRVRQDYDAQGAGSGSCLLEMLDIASADSQARLDFAMAHLYWEAGQQLRLLAPSHLAGEDFGSLLDRFAKEPRHRIGHLARSIDDHHAWITWLQQSQSCRQSVVDDMMESIDRLRDKMWYNTDVKSSAVYEEAKNIAVALKYMGDAPKSSKSKTSIPFLPRTIPRVPTGAFLLKTQAQLVALLSAPTEHGGMAKLSDEQSELTSHWLKQREIVNFCKGEERIHRFCLEVDRCVSKLVGQDIAGAPVLWSSELYSRDKLVLDHGHQPGELDITEWGTLVPVGCAGSGEERQDARRGNDGTYRLYSPALRWEYEQHAIGAGNWTGKNRRSAVDQFQPARTFAGLSVDPQTPGKRSLTFWSPFVEEKGVTAKEHVRPGLQGTYTGRRPPEIPSSPEKQRFLANLRETLLGLVLSDLGTMVWSRGSETDTWFCSELGEEFLRRRDAKSPQPDPLFSLKEPDGIPSKLEEVPTSGAAATDAASSSTQRASTPANPPQPGAPGGDTAAGSTESRSNAASASSDSPSPKEFPYLDSFKYLLRLFSAHPNPFVKIRALKELVSLVSLSLSSRSRPARWIHGRTSHGATGRMPGGYLPEFGYGGQPESVARGARKSFSQGMAGPGPAFAASLDADKVMATLQQLFRDPRSRPPTLFRDLQFISALVPGPLLDATEGGEAFWSAALAAMDLKLDICRMMVEMVDDIVAQHTRTRTVPQPLGAVASADVQQQQLLLPPQQQELVRFSMADAARMLMIPAKEGDAVAQRELATFYLTHPELLARTTMPLSRPRDTFKPQMMKQRDEDPARSDPATLCVAYHWMELSSQGGDELARKNLRARAELNALP